MVQGEKKKIITVILAIVLAITLFRILVIPIFASPVSHTTITTQGSIIYSLPIYQPSSLRGVFKHGFEYANPVTTNWREVNPVYFDYDAALMKSWGCNFVRVSFCSTWYLNDTSYRTIVRKWVDALAENNIYSIMDLQSYGNPPSPGITQGWQKVAETEAWAVFNNEFLPTLQMVANDHLNQPAMVGVEINEFWPLVDETAQWTFDMKMGNTLAAAMRQINPKLITLIDIYPEWASDSVIQRDVSLITEPNIVFAPHIYSAILKDGTPLHPIKAGKYGSGDGWDWWQSYHAGDWATGKQKLYHWLDLYRKSIQTLYNVPFIITEFATNADADCLQTLKDMIAYFDNNNWGYSYFAWYGEDAPYTQLLKGDWTTPQPQGNVLKSFLAGGGF
jgi:hypothetical protein